MLCRLPNQTITRCVRADGSGTSFVFTTALGYFSSSFSLAVNASEKPIWPGSPSVVKRTDNLGIGSFVSITPYSIG